MISVYKGLNYFRCIVFKLGIVDEWFRIVNGHISLMSFDVIKNVVLDEQFLKNFI